MKKIVIHTRYGGFGLTKAAFAALALKWESRERSWEDHMDRDPDLPRDDPRLVDVVEALGDVAGRGLQVVEIPDDCEWEILEFDGKEWVVDTHRIWGPPR